MPRRLGTYWEFVAEVVFQVRRKLLYETKHKIAINFGVDCLGQECYPFLKGVGEVREGRGRKIDPVCPEQSDRLLEELPAKGCMLGI